MIDHTLLRPDAAGRDIHKFVAEAIEHGFAAVCVNGVFVADVAKALHASDVKTCAVAGFPLGAAKAAVKAIEAVAAAKDGADEIDFVAFLPNLLKCDLPAAKAEFMEVVRAARAVRPQLVMKVIIESALLLCDVDVKLGEARIETACRAARESGLDFVKTSTGFHPAGGASVKSVSFMKKHAAGMYVKASGGIRSRADAMKLIDTGADRLGCSASVDIVRQCVG